VAPYTVSFLGAGNEVLAKEEHWFEHDDAALDAIGRSDHPHAIEVRQADRLVALFPAWPPTRHL